MRLFREPKGRYRHGAAWFNLKPQVRHGRKYNMDGASAFL